jgi:hypothetical protein
MGAAGLNQCLAFLLRQVPQSLIVLREQFDAPDPLQGVLVNHPPFHGFREHVLQGRQVSVGSGGQFPLGEQFGLIFLHDPGARMPEWRCAEEGPQLGHNIFFARPKPGLALFCRPGPHTASTKYCRAYTNLSPQP